MARTAGLAAVAVLLLYLQSAVAVEVADTITDRRAGSTPASCKSAASGIISTLLHGPFAGSHCSAFRIRRAINRACHQGLCTGLPTFRCKRKLTRRLRRFVFPQFCSGGGGGCTPLTCQPNTCRTTFMPRARFPQNCPEKCSATSGCPNSLRCSPDIPTCPGSYVKRRTCSCAQVTTDTESVTESVSDTDTDTDTDTATDTATDTDTDTDGCTPVTCATEPCAAMDVQGCALESCAVADICGESPVCSYEPVPDCPSGQSLSMCKCIPGPCVNIPCEESSCDATNSDGCPLTDCEIAPICGNPPVCSYEDVPTCAFGETLNGCVCEPCVDIPCTFMSCDAFSSDGCRFDKCEEAPRCGDPPVCSYDPIPTCRGGETLNGCECDPCVDTPCTPSSCLPEDGNGCPLDECSVADVCGNDPVCSYESIPVCTGNTILDGCECVPCVDVPCMDDSCQPNDSNGCPLESCSVADVCGNPPVCAYEPVPVCAANEQLDGCTCVPCTDTPCSAAACPSVDMNGCAFDSCAVAAQCGQNPVCSYDPIPVCNSAQTLRNCECVACDIVLCEADTCVPMPNMVATCAENAACGNPPVCTYMPM